MSRAGEEGTGHGCCNTDSKRGAASGDSEMIVPGELTTEAQLKEGDSGTTTYDDPNIPVNSAARELADVDAAVADDEMGSADVVANVAADGGAVADVNRSVADDELGLADEARLVPVPSIMVMASLKRRRQNRGRRSHELMTDRGTSSTMYARHRARTWRNMLVYVDRTQSGHAISVRRHKLFIKPSKPAITVAIVEQQFFARTNIAHAD